MRGPLYLRGVVTLFPTECVMLRPISVLRFWISEQNLNIKGWNSHVHRGFPGKFETSNLSRDNVSREIVRTPFFKALQFDIPEKFW